MLDQAGDELSQLLEKAFVQEVHLVKVKYPWNSCTLIFADAGETNFHQHSTKILIKNLRETVDNTNKEREGSPGKSERAVLGTVELSKPGSNFCLSV